MSSSTNKFILKSYVNFKYELRIDIIHLITQYLLLQVYYTYRVIFSCCFNSYNINIKTAILLSCSRLNSRLSFFILSFFECGKVDKLIKASLWHLEVLVMSTLETVLLMIGALCVPGRLRLHRQTLAPLPVTDAAVSSSKVTHGSPQPRHQCLSAWIFHTLPLLS